MLYIMNPPGGRRRRRKVGKRKKRRSAAQRRATAKMLAANRARRAGTRKRKRPHTGVSPMARRRKRHVSAPRRRRRRSHAVARRRHNPIMANPRRRHVRHRRSYRRNPPARGILGGVFQQYTDGLFTLGGGIGTRIINSVVPLSDEGVMGTAKAALSAAVVGWGARQFLGGERGRLVGAGAAEVVWKKVAAMVMGAEVAGKWLGDYDTMGAYAQLSTAGMAGYLPRGGSMYSGAGLQGFEQEWPAPTGY